MCNTAADSMKKRQGIIALLLICIVALGMSVTSVFGAETSAHIIRMELDLQNTVRWENAEGETDPVATGTDKIFYIASPFGDNFSSQGVKLEQGDRIQYCFYTPTPLAGMGGLEMQIYGIDKAGKGVWRNVSGWIGEEQIKDENGMSAFLQDDITQYLGNGWYQRSFEFPTQMYEKYTDIVLWHVWLAGAVDTQQAKAMKDEGRNLVMYYKNFAIVDQDGKVQNIYNEESGGASFSNWEGFTFGNESLNIPNEDPNGGTRFPAYGDTTYYFVAGAQMHLEEVSDPNPLSIQMKQETILLSVSREYTKDELLSYVQTDGVTLEQITDPDGENCTPADGEKFVPQTEGKYVLTFQKVSGEEKVVYNCSVNVYPADKPIILEENLPAETSGVAGEKYYIADVFAYVDGVCDRATKASVERADGTPMEVESDENGTYFIPTVRMATSYTITYTAEGEYAQSGEKTWEKSIVIEVVDMDIPTVDFSTWQKTIEIGMTFQVPGLKVSDPSDGELILSKASDSNGGLTASLKILDSLGREIEISEEGTIRPIISGTYTIQVVCTDSHDNTREYEDYFTVDAIEDAVYSAYMKVSQDSRAQGQRKYFMATTHSTFSDYVTVQQGDKLIFDVYCETPMAGIGSFSGQIYAGGNSWPFIHEFYGTGETALKDSNGESMEPSADISDRLTDTMGNPVWYHREVELSEELVGKNIAHFSPIIDTTDACGEEIEVLYRNVYLLRRGGTKVPILPAETPLDPVVWYKDGADFAALSATLDPTPVLLTQFITAEPKLGYDINIGKDMVFDYVESKVIPLESVKVVDAAGKEYPLSETATGYVFNTLREGTYTLVFRIVKDGKAYTLEHSFTLEDNEDPVITPKEYSETVKAGSDLKVPEVTLSDDITSADELQLAVQVFLDGQEIELPADQTLKNVQPGRYMFVYTCTDAVGNEATLTINIEATEDGGGCDSALTAKTAGAVAAALTLGALFVCFCRKSRKA